MAECKIIKIIGTKWETFTPNTKRAITILALFALAAGVGGGFYVAQRKYQFMPLTDIGQIVGISIAVGVGMSLFVTGLALTIKRLRAQKSAKISQEKADEGAVGVKTPESALHASILRNLTEPGLALAVEKLKKTIVPHYMLYTAVGGGNCLYLYWYVPSESGGAGSTGQVALGCQANASVKVIKRAIDSVLSSSSRFTQMLPE